jgi:feruloyl esterase
MTPTTKLISASLGLMLPLHALLAQPFSNAGDSLAGYSRAEYTPGMACSAVANNIDLPNLVSIASESIAANGDIPAYCRVSGTLDPEITFVVDLPQNWNGRFYMIGNGGHAGQRPDDPFQIAARSGALQHGFAAASTNTGHNADAEPGASFVMSNPQKAIDYAYRAVHLTAVTSKAIATRYYARPVDYAYWNSCSNGGRQGLLEAQRYPDDFDGIVANAPWVDQTGFTIGALWNQRAFDGVSVSPGKMALVAERIMARCDAIDGLTDGLIDDPRNCPVDIATDVPACRAGTDGAACLTSAQAQAIQKVYDGPRTSAGEQIFPGFMPGSEMVAQGFSGEASIWMGTIVPTAPGAGSADFGLANDTMRYLVFQPPRPDYDYRDFNFDTDPELLDRWSHLADATDIDMRAFRENGGKLIMTYGWGDQILQPMMGVNYYEKAVTANGPNGTDFMRLFMVPGMSHCAGGIGPDQNDAITAVIDWVEAGMAPDRIEASKIVNGDVVRSRPLCPYPEVARYNGNGSIDAASNFQCVSP